MFSEKAHAMLIGEAMLSINTLLNYSLFRLEESGCSKSEQKAYAKKVGEIMGITTMDVLEQIWLEHPDLMPFEFRKTAEDS